MTDTLHRAVPLALLATLLPGVADPGHLACLRLLRAGLRTLGAVVAATGPGQRTVSRHGACWRDGGLVPAARSSHCVTDGLSGAAVEDLPGVAAAALHQAGAGRAACRRYRARGR